MRRHDSAIVLTFFLVAVFTVALLGSVFVALSPPGWYSQPSWAPPESLFGPVWTVLYIMMAASAWLVWRKSGAEARKALVMFAVQLALNAAWTPVFFGLQAPGAALAVIVLLWFAIGATIVAFVRHSRFAAILLVPYMLWVSFAAALNWSIWRLTD